MKKLIKKNTNPDLTTPYHSFYYFKFEMLKGSIWHESVHPSVFILTFKEFEGL